MTDTLYLRFESYDHFYKIVMSGMYDIYLSEIHGINKIDISYLTYKSEKNSIEYYTKNSYRLYYVDLDKYHHAISYINSF